MPHSKPIELPRKPHPDFPLYAHRSDRWAKKVRGKTLYFGKATTDPSDGLALRELCNKFLEAKRTRLDLGKLSPRTFVEYSRTTDLLIATFGKDRLVIDLRPDDFTKLSARSPDRARRHGLLYQIPPG